MNLSIVSYFLNNAASKVSPSVMVCVIYHVFFKFVSVHEDIYVGFIWAHVKSPHVIFN